MATIVHLSRDKGNSYVCGKSAKQSVNDEWLSENEWPMSATKHSVICKDCDNMEYLPIKPIHAADMDFGMLLGYIMQRCEDNTRDAFAAFTADSDSARKYMRVFTHLDNAVKAYTGK